MSNEIPAIGGRRLVDGTLASFEHRCAVSVGRETEKLNSDNALIRRELDWAPEASLRAGMEETYAWIATQVESQKQRTPSDEVSAAPPLESAAKEGMLR